MLNDTGAFGVSARDVLRAQAPAAGINVVAWEEFQPSDNDLTTQLTRIRGHQRPGHHLLDGHPGRRRLPEERPAARAQADARARLRLRGRPLHAAGRRRRRGAAPDLAEVPGGRAASRRRSHQGHHPRLQGAVPRPVQGGDRRLRRAGLGRHQHGGAGHRPRAADAKDKIRAGLETDIKEFKGVGGIFTFSPEKHWGLAKSDVVMIEWRQGKFRLVDL